VTTSNTQGPDRTGRKPTGKSNASTALWPASGYARAYTSENARAATYHDWLHNYNHHRAHTGIGGLTPIERLRVHNLTGKYT